MRDRKGNIIEIGDEVAIITENYVTTGIIEDIIDGRHQISPVACVRPAYCKFDNQEHDAYWGEELEKLPANSYERKQLLFLLKFEQ